MKKAYSLVILLFMLISSLESYAFREPMTHGYYPEDDPHSHISSNDIINSILSIVVIVLIIKGIKWLIDFFKWKKAEKKAAEYRAIQEEKTRREKERESLDIFLQELNQRTEKRRSEEEKKIEVNRTDTTILNEVSTHQRKEADENRILSKERCKQSFLAKQSVLSYECMNLSWEKKCRFLFTTATLSEDGKRKIASNCYIACLYSFEYNKCSDITLWNGYTRAVELSAMNRKEDDTIYDNYMRIIEYIKEISKNNVVLLFPIPNKRNWKKYKTFHYSYFISELNRIGVYHTDNINDPALSKEGVNIIIFSLCLKKGSVFDIVSKLIIEHITTKPSFVYLTIYLETDKNGRPYLTNNTKLPSNDF